jgi:hypothetical protein
MAGLSMAVVTGQLLAVLREAFEGPPGGGSYFTDSGPEAGWFGTLARVTAEQASRPWGGSTIAAHTHHMAFSVEASTAWILGERKSLDWDESWSVKTVDAAAWSRLQEELRRGYERLRDAIQAHASDGEDAVGGAVGVVAHAAYHLGAVRQKIMLGRTPAA